MNIKTRRLWNEGKQLWQEYINVNGYSFSPTARGLKELSRILDLNIKYIRQRINIFLEN